MFAVHEIHYKHKNKECVQATVVSRPVHKKFLRIEPGKNYPLEKRILATCLRA